METKWFRIVGDFFESKAKAENLSDGWEKTFEKWDLFKLGLRTVDPAGSCGLCNLYLPPANPSPSCHGCPVEVATGRNGCYGTPYDRILHGEPPKQVAEEEIAFLKRVRETFEKQRETKFNPNDFFLFCEHDQLYLKYKERNGETWYVLTINPDGLQILEGIKDAGGIPFKLDHEGMIVIINKQIKIIDSSAIERR